jgi:hypothetical protein
MRSFRIFLLAVAAATLIASAARTPSAVSRRFPVEEATIGQVHSAMRAELLTCRELVSHYLERIETYARAQRDRPCKPRGTEGGRPP